MRDVKRHLSSLDLIEPPDVWERATSREPSQDETVTPSPWKRGTAAIVAFAVFGAAALFAIRAFESAPTDRDRGPRRSVPGDARGVWQALPDGPLSPRHGALAFWVDGRVVVFGGYDSDPCPPTASCGFQSQPLVDGATFAPSTGTWTTIAPAPIPIAYSSGAVLGDSVYLWTPRLDRAGGESFVSYDVNEDRWDELPMPTGVDLPNYGLLAATDDAIVVYADSQERSQDRGVFPDLLFDPSTGDWRELPPDPLIPSFDRSMVWTGEELLLFGIEVVPPQEPDYRYRAAALDIATDTWRRFPDSDILGYNPTWLWSTGRAVNPTIGRDGDNGAVKGSGPPYGGLLDPRSGTWSDLPRPPGDLREHDLSEYGGPSVGGSDHVVSWQGAILDVAAGTWSALPAAPVAADEGAAVAWAGDRLIVWGGFDWEDTDPRNPEGTLLSTGWSWKP